MNALWPMRLTREWKVVGGGILRSEFRDWISQPEGLREVGLQSAQIRQILPVDFRKGRLFDLIHWIARLRKRRHLCLPVLQWHSHLDLQALQDTRMRQLHLPQHLWRLIFKHKGST